MIMKIMTSQKKWQGLRVFLVQGLTTAWSHVLSFYVSETSVSGQELKTMLLQNISVANSIDPNIKLTTCDKGSNNRSCYKNLGVSSDKPFFHQVNQGKKIITIYDSPHLIKSIGNTHITT